MLEIDGPGDGELCKACHPPARALPRTRSFGALGSNHCNGEDLRALAYWRPLAAAMQATS